MENAQQSQEFSSPLMSRLHPHALSALYASAGLLQVVAAALDSQMNVTRLGILFGAGAVLWTLVEYTVHRFPFHTHPIKVRGQSSAKSHLDHHKAPDDVMQIGSPLYVSLPAYAVLFAFLALTVPGGLAAVLAVSGGLAFAYGAYEYMHFWSHHGKARTSIGRYMKRFHMIHHYKAGRKNFGVTSPVWDIVFGSYVMRK